MPLQWHAAPGVPASEPQPLHAFSDDAQKLLRFDETMLAVFQSAEKGETSADGATDR